MEDTEIINIWKTYDKKLEKSLLLNKQNTEELTKMKVQSSLTSITPLKIFGIVIGLIWVGFVDLLIISLFPVANPFFLASAIIQVICTKLAIGIYLYQLILIRQVNINAAVLTTQAKLARLRSSTIWVARISFLQLPVWTTFYWNKSMLENGNMGLYLLQAFVTLSFIFMAIWLFKNISYKNRDKKWFRLIFGGKEWDNVLRSIALLEQVESYANENE